MRYFEIFDDVYIWRRWHLSKVMHGNLEPNFKLSIPFQGSLTTRIHDGHRPLQFCLTSFAVPIACRRLAQAMAIVASNDLQRLPVDIVGHPGYEVINLLRTLDCLDEYRSRFELYEPGYHRPHKIGHYKDVWEAHMDASRIPPNVHAFRVARWYGPFIVSETMRHAMERAGCYGASFRDVT